MNPEDVLGLQSHFCKVFTEVEKVTVSRGWEERVEVPMGWEEGVEVPHGLGGGRGGPHRLGGGSGGPHRLGGEENRKLISRGKASLSAIKELWPRIRCMCQCVPTTHKDNRKGIPKPRSK